MHKNCILECSFIESELQILDVFEKLDIDSKNNLCTKSYDLKSIKSVEYDETKPSYLRFKVADIKTHEMETIILKGCQNQLSLEWLPLLIKQSKSITQQKNDELENKTSRDVIQHAIDSISQIASNSESLNSKNISELNSILKILYFYCIKKYDHDEYQLISSNITIFNKIVTYCKTVILQFISIQFPQKLTQTDTIMLNRCLECIESSIYFIS